MGVNPRRLVFAAAVTIAAGTAGAARGPSADGPTFKASVDLVSVAAVVRDRQGHVVRDLSRDDFEVYDNGLRRPIVGFTPSADGPVSLAVLLDVSGSMGMGRRIDAARGAVELLVRRLRRESDEVALFTFDEALREARAFGHDFEAVRRVLPAVEPFGITALYDAIAETTRRLEDRRVPRRAALVVTDGLDNGSSRSAEEVSAQASATDVPVYVLALVDALDRQAMQLGRRNALPAGQLSNLAEWTGGRAFLAQSPAQVSVAADHLLGDLRHQYLLAFEAGPGTGWRPLDIRLRRPKLTIQARSGYVVSPRLG